MTRYAVIDTNVLVSAMIKPISIPGEIINCVADEKIIPLLHNEILTEYARVINRPRFKFSQEHIEKLLNKITVHGKFIDAKEYDEDMPDPKDKIFYWVTLTAREEVEAYLVTENLKHFPIKPFIVTPREMLEILESDGDC